MKEKPGHLRGEQQILVMCLAGSRKVRVARGAGAKGGLLEISQRGGGVGSCVVQGLVAPDQRSQGCGEALEGSEWSP